MRVPVLGSLFSRKSSSSDRRNLLILVTAHIIDPSGARISDEVRTLRDKVAVVLSDGARDAQAGKQVVEREAAAAAQRRSEGAAPRPSASPERGLKR